MALNDSLANILSHLLNSEKVGKGVCAVKNLSKVSITVLNLLKEKKYIGKIEITETSRGKIATIELLGAINKCCVIKPRFSVKFKDYERFERRFLPAKDFGLIIVSTNKGIMAHNEAIEKKIGGKLIAYCY